MGRLTAFNLVRAISQLPRNRDYNYINPKTKTRVAIQSVTEPLVRPFRNLLWKFSSQMGIDFSPILAILAVQFVARLLTRVLITI